MVDERIGARARRSRPRSCTVLAEAPHGRRHSARRDRAPHGAVHPRCRGCAATSRDARRARTSGFRAVAVVAPVVAVHHQRDAVVSAITRSSVSHHNSPMPVGKAGRKIERERRVVFLQDRHRVLQIVAIAVVEGEADEAAAEIALDQPPVHLVERDEIDAASAAAAEHVFEETRRHLEQPVRLERVARAAAARDAASGSRRRRR